MRPIFLNLKSAILARFTAKLILVFTACLTPIFASSAYANQSKAAPTSVIAYKVDYQNIPQNLTMLAELKALNSVQLTSSVTDVVSAIYFKDGQEVAKDQLLIEFNNEQELAELKEKQISAIEAKKQYLRLKKLQGKVSVSQASIDEQYRNWQVFEAQVNSLKAELQNRQIRAPFSGVLGLKDIVVGDFINQGQALVSLTNNQTMQLDFEIADKFLNSVKPGQKVELISQSYPDKVFLAHINAISPQLSADTRMIKLRALLKNNQQLASNMLVQAKIKLSDKRILAIPNKSILMLGDHSYVYRLSPLAEKTDKGEIRYKVEKVQIKTGLINANRTEVLSGLKQQDIIVSQGILLVNPNKQVTIKSFENNQSQTQLLLKEVKSSKSVAK